MAYSAELAQRIEQAVSKWRGIGSRKMFGGVAFLLHGNMLCGIHKDLLILRLGEEAACIALEQPNVRKFDITGRPMKGWVMVEPSEIAADEDLAAWLEEARRFVRTLPAK